ncbi:hypothetical protein TTHERM_00074260 (macronuclear) [Tetrahymena thermophila SB210]|uniref:Uncharacterized protein n=1 Tax=Tetrahymena thermophila (strain SB210) TaxID=312017 RepID=Q23GE0_TETTS|nr:hypothetical protein TTHERM_00074260 [Tetrahymena thermophila SB210]EAR95320.2 hypothetical protein TTHERM_00074260 [Tetrahymena thermophila SB210]|eukprot:XP_001015565.2 hypothetical protein TTHERM_00074260 [Tetrahymena thermophila SB210]
MNKVSLQDNMEKQRKRLEDQLEEIEQMKDELDKDEYEQLKKETLEQLETFNKGLKESEGSKKVELKESKIQGILNAQVQQEAAAIRVKIQKIEQAYHLKQVNLEQLTKEKLNLINQMSSELKVPLTQDEQKFQHEHTGKGNFISQKQEIKGDKLISEANDQIQKHF